MIHPTSNDPTDRTDFDTNQRVRTMKSWSFALLLSATVPVLALGGCQTVEDDGYSYSTTTYEEGYYVDRPVYDQRIVVRRPPPPRSYGWSPPPPPREERRWNPPPQPERRWNPPPREERRWSPPPQVEHRAPPPQVERRSPPPVIGAPRGAPPEEGSTPLFRPGH